MKLPGESQSEALLRLVATHFINKGQIDNDIHMNTLSLPIYEACSQELKALFLNKENRMLVFSTHLPMDVDTVLRLY
jgi:hypothetical protein